MQSILTSVEDIRRDRRSAGKQEIRPARRRLPEPVEEHPLGFKTVEMTQLVSNQVVQQTRQILNDKLMREEWAENNYKLGLKYFSYAVVRRKLAARLANLFGEGV